MAEYAKKKALMIFVRNGLLGGTETGTGEKYVDLRRSKVQTRARTLPYAKSTHGNLETWRSIRGRYARQIDFPAIRSNNKKMDRKYTEQ